MPQMNPLSWLTLMLWFILHFVLVNSINYFFINTTSSSSIIKIQKKTSKIWQW